MAKQNEPSRRIGISTQSKYAKPKKQNEESASFRSSLAVETFWHHPIFEAKILPPYLSIPSTHCLCWCRSWQWSRCWPFFRAYWARCSLSACACPNVRIRSRKPLTGSPTPQVKAKRCYEHLLFAWFPLTHVGPDMTIHMSNLLSILHLQASPIKAK